MMRRFAALFESLDTTTSTRAKVEAMSAYFRAAAPSDAAWAVYILIGRRLKRSVGPVAATGVVARRGRSAGLAGR